MARKFNSDEVTFGLTAEPEEFAPDFDFDDDTNERILADAEDNVWAWACVKVSASWGGFTGDVYLGGCNYKDEADFRANSGYFEDLLREAMENLLQKIKDAGWEVVCTGRDVEDALKRGLKENAA